MRMNVKQEIDGTRLAKELLDQLENAGFQARLLPARYMDTLNTEMSRRRRQLHRRIYRCYLTRFDTTLPDGSRNGTLIIVAAPQPPVRVAFTFNGRQHHTEIPPTYHHAVGDTARDLLRGYLDSHGYHLWDLHLPKKLLAVHSGLARYGRNNLAYIPGLGSYHRLIAFASDLPVPDRHWGELQALELCHTCRACVRKCPTGAIDEQRFLIHAERCLTRFNENPDPFPAWIDPDSHHAPVGCMRCQETCPENKDLQDWYAPGETFSARETRDLLDGKPPAALPDATMAKLRRLYLLDYLPQLPRNLAALLGPKSMQPAPPAEEGSS